MPSPFELATKVSPIGEGRYSATVPEGWAQGRGAFGGVVLGLLARAMIAAEPDDSRVLRMFSGDVCGPVQPGPVTLETNVLRRGNNLTNLNALLIQDGAVLASASAGLSTARSTAGDVLNPPSPTRPPIEQTLRVNLPGLFAPSFAGHFAYQPTGPLPFSAAADPIVEGYISATEPGVRFDPPAIIGHLDAYWPAIFSTATKPRGAATVGFGAQILCDVRALDASIPLFYRGVVTSIRDGFFIEMRELWSDDTLIAMNQQTMALLA